MMSPPHTRLLPGYKAAWWGWGDVPAWGAKERRAGTVQGAVVTCPPAPQGKICSRRADSEGHRPQPPLSGPGPARPAAQREARYPGPQSRRRGPQRKQRGHSPAASSVTRSASGLPGTGRRRLGRAHWTVRQPLKTGLQKKIPGFEGNAAAAQPQGRAPPGAVLGAQRPE